MMCDGEISRWSVGVRAAARSLIPVVVTLIVLYADGEICKWSDLISPKAVGAVLAAIGVKGLYSATTAKDVTVRR